MIKGYFRKGNFRISICRAKNYTTASIVDLTNEQIVWKLEGKNHEEIIQKIDGALGELN